MITWSSTLTNLAHFAALGRPLHLIGGWIFFGLGTVIAHINGAVIDWALVFGGLITVAAIQLMTHYSNDYFDLDADIANATPSQWSGGSRVLAEGKLQPQMALAGTVGCAICALAVGSWLILASRAPQQTLALLGLALVLAWSYSAPPLQLNRRALGEIAGALLIPGLTALVGFQVQAGGLALLPLLAIIPLCCFQFAMLTAVNFPDANSDAAVGKITLVVRLGGRRAAQLYCAVVLAPYVLLPLLVSAGLPRLVAALLLCAAPIAAWLVWCVGRGGWRSPQSWDALGFWSIGLLVGSALLELIGFVLLARIG